MCLTLFQVDEDVDWAVIKPDIYDTIMDFFVWCLLLYFRWMKTWIGP